MKEETIIKIIAVIIVTILSSIIVNLLETNALLVVMSGTLCATTLIK